MNIFAWSLKKIIFVYGLAFVGEWFCASAGYGTWPQIIVGFIFFFAAILIHDEWVKRQKQLGEKSESN